MQHWITVFGSMLLALGCAAPALARSTTLVGGGLTALPTATLGPDRLDNGGFETLVGGVPAAWTTGPGLAVDERVAHAGGVSYRATGDFASATQIVQLTRGVYRLSGWIRTQNVGLAPGAGVRLQFDLRPFVNDWTTSGLVAGTTGWTLYELPNLVVAADTTVTIRLENHRSGTGTAWFDDVRLQEQEPSAVEAFLLYPNFRGMLFDDQPPVMRFDVMVRPPGGDLGRFQVRGTLAEEATGRVLVRRHYPASARFVATLDGGAMPTHRPHLATFALVDASDGVVVAEYPAYRVSRVPASARAGMNVAVDARNRVLVRGVPRFVLGVYDTGPGHGTEDSFWENHLWSRLGERRLDTLRINFYLDYRHGEAPAGAVKALMSSLQKRGVMYLQAGHCFATRAAGPGFGIQRSDGYVRDIGAHPGSGGYYAADACPSTLIPEVFAQYDRLRRLDPDSITLVTHPSAPDLALWRDGADVLSSAPAPLVGAPPAGGYRHREVADATALARRAVEDARPVMTALPFSSGTSRGRFPTRQEMRNHAWMAVVEGARGLWWWTLGDNGLSAVCPGWCAEKSRRLGDLAAVVGELADLEPALLGDEAPGALTGNSHPAAIRTRVTVVDGTGYVFAYNATEAPVRATLSWNAPGGTVTVHAEGRTLAASGGSFTDSFAPYAAHVYVIGGEGIRSASPGAAVRP